MSKRKLNRRQSWRINKIQEERARRADKRDVEVQQNLLSGELGPEQEGTVIAHFGTQVAVEGDHGVVLRCHMRANLEGLVTGDRVIWREGDGSGVVVASLPRHNALSRPDAYGNIKPVAANIDQILIVIAPLPQPHANLVDRYLVAAETVAIEPVIVLNKIDLLGEGAADPLRASVDELLSVYPGIGYRVLRASSRTAHGMDALHAALRERTSVFVGQSGVGKSSLINTLLPGEDLRVGALSENTGKGTHTTTTAQLFHFPAGGELIDSPGIREFGLWHMDRDTIEAGFREFRPFLGHCKFRDCRHAREPGCAILAAVEQGAISSRRFASYQHLVSD